MLSGLICPGSTSFLPVLDNPIKRDSLKYFGTGLRPLSSSVAQVQ